MINPIQAFKLWRERRKLENIKQFAHNHRNYLVIVADPKDDTMFVSYKDEQIAAKIKSHDGHHHEVVRRVLRHSTFESAIDRFLATIIDALHCPIQYFSDFGKFIDGAIWNISKKLQDRQAYKDELKNRLMKEIVDTKNTALYEEHKDEFTDSECRYLEEKINEESLAPVTQ